MGQACSGSATDVTSDPTNQTSSASSNGPQLGSVLSKADTVWRQTHARRIHELIETLSAEDVQRLLVSQTTILHATFHHLSRSPSPFVAK